MDQGETPQDVFSVCGSFSLSAVFFALDDSSYALKSQPRSLCGHVECLIDDKVVPVGIDHS